MTRRDTIIAAALVNAGLLVILFVSALKNEDKREGFAHSKGYTDPILSEKEIVLETKKSAGVDEVEEVLKRYAQKEAPADTIFQQQPIVMAAPVEVKEMPPVIPIEKEVATATVITPKDKDISKESYIEVEVKKGDMLEKIAKQHHTTVSDIMKLNGLSSTRLRVGQMLKVSKKEETAKPSTVAVKAPLDPTSAKYYTIKAGDNLWTIAVRNHSRVEDLLKLNNMTEEKAKKLKPGDTIRIR
jgi:LysM repeat protein